MTEALVWLGLSNLLLSAAVGLMAYAVHRGGHDPALAHLLWVLTLIVAVAPPVLVFSLPLATEVALAPGSVSEASSVNGATPVAAWLRERLPALLVVGWITGSLVVLTASAQRIVRFGRLLRRSCRPAPPGIGHLARVVAYELDMQTVPSVHLSGARLAPMTWWSGGRVRVVLPEALRHEVDDDQLRWILAHELAHIKRRDHLVRWLEWLASVAFWWNPIVWWSRRNLRRDEEDACDALVLHHLQGQPRAYARTLLKVVEVMAAPTDATPTLATGIDAARSLERRLTRIVSGTRGHRAPRVVTAGSVATALLLMTLGVNAQADPATNVTQPNRDRAPRAVPIMGVTVPARAALDSTPPAPMPGVSRKANVVAATATLRLSGALAEDGRYVGTAAADSLTGSADDESFKGFAGADVIGGGPGRDAIDGGDGADTIRGGDGADRLNGGRGRDTIGGGAGADTINGGAGADVIQGGAGRDTIAAGAGDDVVRVWADGTPDVVDCGGGNDRAVIGSSDTATRCETVIIRDPS